MIADAVKAKRGRLAMLDCTDAKGTVTPIRQFLAEELSMQMLVADEITVVYRIMAGSALKRFQGSEK